jgi:hypothetical protein
MRSETRCLGVWRNNATTSLHGSLARDRERQYEATSIRYRSDNLSILRRGQGEQQTQKAIEARLAMSEERVEVVRCVLVSGKVRRGFLPLVAVLAGMRRSPKRVRAPESTSHSKWIMSDITSARGPS